MSIGARIKAAREALGWSARHLAQHVNVSPPLISLWENDHRTPSLEQMVQLADALCTNLSHIRYGVNDPLDLEDPMTRSPDELEALRHFRRLTDRQRQNILGVLRHSVVIRDQIESQREPA